MQHQPAELPKRMMESTGRYAATIHRLLDLIPYPVHSSITEHNALIRTLWLLMKHRCIDIFLAHSLIRRFPHGARVVFIGDVDQLPSVGRATFSLILSNHEKFHDTPYNDFQTSPKIVLLLLMRTGKSWRISDNKLPDARNDFIFIQEDSPKRRSLTYSGLSQKSCHAGVIALDQSRFSYP